MSLLARAVAPRATKRVTVSEDGTYAVGPTLDSIAMATGWDLPSSYSALNFITIYQCVRVLSNTFAQLPLMLYRRLENGGKERATDHPLYDTLHLRPNPEMSSFAWRRLMMVHLATWGNAYSEIVTDGFGGTQLYPIRPDRMEVSREDGVKVFDYLDPRGGKKRFRRGSVFHVAGMSTDGLVGRSPLTDLRTTINLGKSAERHGESTFRNGARPAIVMKHPKTLSTDAITRLAGQMDAMRGAGNAGKTVLLEEGLDFAEIGIPNKDAQFMETRLFQKRELAGAYGIQLHKIGDLERATFSNIEHQSLEFITDTMMPHFVNVEQEISIQLVGEEPDIFAEFLVDGYLRGDAKSRNEAYAIRWQHGNLSPNEWRIKENDNPVDGGDTFYVPVNYKPTIAVAGVDPLEIAQDFGTAVQRLGLGMNYGVITDAEARQFLPVQQGPTPVQSEQPPALVAVKAMRQFDCPDCGKLINRLAALGTVGHCKSCKAEKTFTEAGQPEVAA